MKASRYISFIIICVLVSVPLYPAEVTVKIRDMATVDGQKTNQVFGYGLVVGLPGTGDSKSPLTMASLRNMLKNLGLEGDDFVSKNAAAVLVTAYLPAFSRVGERVDVTVSSIGDAKSLEGGILVQSPLKGGDGEVYVVAQGSLVTEKPGNKGRVIRTVAAITGGGLIEREISPEIVSAENRINLVLRKQDYSATDAIIKAIKEQYPDSAPSMASDGRIAINIAKDVPLPEFISTIENLEITTGEAARVVIDERSGTIVAGGDVKVSDAMVSREGVTVEIQGTDRKGTAVHIKESATVKELVDALNSINASTADIIAIMKALKEAGALHGELVVR